MSHEPLHGCSGTSSNYGPRPGGNLGTPVLRTIKSFPHPRLSIPCPVYLSLLVSIFAHVGWGNWMFSSEYPYLVEIGHPKIEKPNLSWGNVNRKNEQLHACTDETDHDELQDTLLG